MQQSYEIKPDKSAFVTYKFLVRFFIFAVLFSVIYLFFGGYFADAVVYFIGAFLVLILFNYYILSVRYRKERYVFSGDNIVRKSGGIFSDSETELVVRNITHVTLKLPFIQNKLFKTGSVTIESAGSGKAKIVLSSINNPGQIYEYVEKIMKYVGFKLTKSQLIEEEKPSTLGVFFETFKTSVGGIFVVLWIAFAIIGEAEVDIVALVSSNSGPILLVGAIIAIGLFLRSIFKFMDLKKRTYRIFTDTITYEEGFLSKNYSFIPVENLSDSTITQTLVDKIFGLYDVKVSCQGSRQEIHFKNIVNGEKLHSNIGSLINKKGSLVGKSAKIQKSFPQAQAVTRDTTFTAEFRMDGKRTIVPLLILLPIGIFLFPVWIILFISLLIKVSATRYFVKANSVEEKYNFITTKNKEFTNDKVTAVIFKESFVDKWFKTCTIQFWSIGSSEDIRFTNIKKTPSLYESILSKSGISAQKTLRQMDSHYSVSAMLMGTLPVTLISMCVIFGSVWGALYNILFIIPAVVLVLLYIITIIYRTVYYGKSKLTFFSECVYFTRGIFFKEFYYALYDNVKDISTLKYPFSKKGSISFNVAGEHVMQQSQRGRQQIVSNSFRIRYVDDVSNKDELIDMVFYQRPSAEQIVQMEKNIQSYSPKPILEARPAVANSLFTLILISILIFPLIVILPITLILVIWGVKVKSFTIQPYRALANSGILYKKQVSIVFNKIDHIDFSQGFFNKMFRNGNVVVNTTGSSRAELIIKNIPNFKEFFEELKRHY